MQNQEHQPITVSTTVNAPEEKVWACWTQPEHIKQWNAASDDWHTPHSENDLRVGGKFKNTMAAKDGSFGFDFEGTYTNVVAHKTVQYEMIDGRKVKIEFEAADSGVRITETFDPEMEHPVEMQQQGWQSILNNFKKYTEAQA